MVALAVFAVYAVWGEGITAGSAAGFVGFLVGLVAGGVGGIVAAASFGRDDGHSERTKIALAWVSCAGIVALAFVLAFGLDLAESDGMIGQLGQGAIRAFVGFFWLGVLGNTVWRSRGGVWPRRLFEWLALSATASLSGIVVGAVVDRFVVSPLIQTFAA